MDTLSDFAAIIAVFLLAGLIKGVIGLGLPTVSVGLLSTVMAPAQAAALLIVPSLVTNVWQLAIGPSLRPLLRRLAPMMVAIVVGTMAGGGRLAAGDAMRATLGLGVALMLYAGLGLARIGLRRVPPAAEPWLSVLVGAATGVVAAQTGVFVLPAVPYLQALGLDKDDLVQALGLSFTVSTVALAADLIASGSLGGGLAFDSLAALAPALIGMAGGQWLRRRVRPEVFRRCLLLGLLGLGLHLVIHGWR